MRHRIYGRILGRTKNQRTGLFRSLVRELLLWEKIETTAARAKAIKGLVDRLITQAKSPNTRRLISQFLVDKRLQEKLIKDIAPRLKGRTSGFTSITRLGRRLGDRAAMVQVRLLTEGEPKKVTGKKADVISSESEKSPDSKTKSADSSPAKPDQNDKKSIKVEKKGTKKS